MTSWCSKLFFAVLMALAPYSLQALDLVKEDLSHSAISVTLEDNGYAPGKKSWLAITFTPQKEWHTYWENYGDSGAAPILNWQTPDTVAVGKPVYPAPELIPVGPLMNYGYHGASTLLIPITFAEQASDSGLALSLAAEWLVCKIECIPQFGEWSFTISSGKGKAETARAVFREARSKVPEPSYWQSDLQLYQSDALLTVFASKPDFEEEIVEAYFFPLAEGIAHYAAPQLWQWMDEGLQIQIERPEGAVDVTAGGGVLSLTLSSGNKLAYTINPDFKTNVTNSGSSASKNVTPDTGVFSLSLPLWQALLFALAGGVILNLMPCVFPVLSLKVMALAKGHSKNPSQRLWEGWSYTAGIWISFMVIVLLLEGLRAGGMAVGWGFQLQSPLFVAALAAIMLTVSLALFGMFTIETGLEATGDALTKGSDLKAAFFKGILATLVATPCTAPLMAPAIGFALTQSILINLFVFSALAFGMALPFLALCYSDKVASLMPKPGTWMVTLRQALAFPMLLTVCWLIYVYSIQTDETAVFVLLCSLTAVGLALWLWQKAAGKTLKTVAILILIGSFYAVRSTSKTESSTTEVIENSNIFSETRLQNLLQNGKPTFVYFTAEWCITCKVNEKTVLNTAEIQKSFQELNITVLKADWTNRNDEIAAILARFGRAGVPMYLYYPAGKTEPVLLPELLTKSILKDTLKTGE